MVDKKLASGQTEQTALEPFVRAAYPMMTMGMKFLDDIWPYAEQAFSVGMSAWRVVEPYKDSWMPLVFGIILILFGGSLPLTIAAVEAFRLCGWDKSKDSIQSLWHQFKVAKDASDKDNLRDNDNDGIADVKQIDAKQLITRKAALFLKVSDPVKLQDAFAGVTAGATAVIATLRLQFALTITLGVSLGDLFINAAEKFVRPTLEHVVPREHHKWIPFIIQSSCRTLGVQIAWWCQRVISAMHSAMRGSDMLLYGLMSLVGRHHVQLPFHLSKSHPAYPAAVTALAVAGFYVQLGRGFGLPFPFNFLLMPLRILEFVISWTMAYGSR